MKREKPRIAAVCFVVLWALLSGCSDSGNPVEEETAREGAPIVHVTNYPLYYFADRIAGDTIDLRFPAGAIPDDPAFWKPSDDDIAEMQRADIILINGATYEKWIETVSLPLNTVFDTTDAFSGDFLSSGEVIVHSHGPGGEHSHGGTAITTWMDFNQAIWQAEAVRDVLIKKMPEYEAVFRDQFDKLADDIDALHQEFKEIGKSLDGIPLVGSHPVYQYFARRYDLDIEAVHWEPSAAPDAEAIEELKDLRKGHPAKWMIWEAPPMEESIKALEGMGLKSIVIDPSGNRPREGDWLSVMQSNAANLRKVSN